MKTVLKCIASVVVGFLIWFVLYLVLFSGLVLASIKGDFINRLLGSLSNDFWHLVIVFNIPAAVSGLVSGLILKKEPRTARICAKVVLIALVAIEILSIEGFSIQERLLGALVVVFVYVCTP
jgi:hypothetical protein